MKTDPYCELVQIDISALSDGEETTLDAVTIEEHLATCAACRSFEGSLQILARSIRLQSAKPVPDLTAEILGRVGTRTIEPQKSGLHHLRTALVSAAATIVLLWGSTWIGGPPPNRAEAASIAREIRAAARGLEGYSATFDVVERNWSSEVTERHFRAEVGFTPPERFELEVDDLTPEDDSYVEQDYGLVAGAHRWRSSSPNNVADVSHFNRQPFDGTAFVPTDVIMPLESIASAPGLDRLGEKVIEGQRAFGVRVPFVVATPLVRSLDPFSVWRAFYPTDEVTVWLDTDTWFPLRFTIHAASSDDRAIWAARSGLIDVPGELVLTATVEGAIHEVGNVTPSVAGSAGLSTDGGFRESGTFEPVPRGPRDVGGLQPYRSGVSVSGEKVASYSAGLAWLKVTRSLNVMVPLAEIVGAEEVRTDQGVLYYTPAGPSHLRRIDAYDGRTRLRLESNLSRAELLRIARSMGVPGNAIDARGSGTRRATVEEASDLAFARFPTRLPEGYRVSGVFITERGADATSLSINLRPQQFETDATWILITETPDRALPPTSEEPVVVRVGDVSARWSVERGELEFVDDGTYVSILVPSFDLDTAMSVAQDLL